MKKPGQRVFHYRQEVDDKSTHFSRVLRLLVGLHSHYATLEYARVYRTRSTVYVFYRLKPNIHRLSSSTWYTQLHTVYNIPVTHSTMLTYPLCCSGSSLFAASRGFKCSDTAPSRLEEAMDLLDSRQGVDPPLSKALCKPRSTLRMQCRGSCVVPCAWEHRACLIRVNASLVPTRKAKKFKITD